MRFADALTRMEALLAEEREAIRQIDADRIVGLADEKESLMQAMYRGGLEEGSELAPRFHELVLGLRDNGVLLAHARNCVSDAIQLAAAPSGTYGAGQVANQASRPTRSLGTL